MQQQFQPWLLLIPVISFLCMVGSGYVLLRSGVQKSTLDAYKMQAEQVRLELQDTKTLLNILREELGDLNKDHKTLKEDHENLKTRYIEVSDENRRQLRTLSEAVLTKLECLEVYITTPPEERRSPLPRRKPKRRTAAAVPAAPAGPVSADQLALTT